MQRIINFVLRYRNTFLYVFFAFIALVMTIQSHSYHQSKFFNSSRWISGSIYGAGADVSSYFNLKKENKRLVEENQRLRKMLFNAQDDSVAPLDSTLAIYQVLNAKLIKNSFTSPRNYVTIDKGEKDGVHQDMGVITTDGILGIVENVSTNFATVQSVLNTKSNINAKIKGTKYFGSLIWDAKNYRVVQLIDIPRLVPVVVGDTIVTGGMSSIFPENVPIGTIKKYDLNASQSFYNIDVELFSDMANIKNVYLIENKDREEIEELESRTIE
ncbi:MAG: rod shape-determining protein MreC [Muricauda sp.]|jgi:rod shape-determining protein MreC|nr:rod shape-determining protein MreC [Allomuricauda sp.]MBO6533694.1 rod shape-determining protein MreC [Allomuricauda sp.]MBO6587573.1 rod shape-determining protein MreC [Allomuricauda sp.]MBO6617198.1 rod shape-determining protein MreC [Allomuricauda sp.]MBO6643791.1 rod shape-determining protein MreC [Allomuricauda sp.]MBO6745533.1 rod shape-determining protein MreC [Allomuricauda sp.]